MRERLTDTGVKDRKDTRGSVRDRVWDGGREGVLQEKQEIKHSAF